MKNEKKKLLAKIAYLYYVENKNQTEIANILGIYRTTISRMLAQARKEGIVKIEIVDFDSEIFELEEYFRKKYQLSQVEIVECRAEDSEEEKNEALASAAALFVKSLVNDNQVVGTSWGSTLSRMIEKLDNRYVEDTLFCPLAGGPSHINSKYHVNTLVYALARKFHGQSAFVNATVIQETPQLSQGILQSKYFEDILAYWERLDVAILGVGGNLDHSQSQWRDLLTEEDYRILEAEKAVGESCCRFFDQEGNPVHQELQERTIGIPLEKLAKVPKSVAIARGENKEQAFLAMLRKKYVNCVVTDRETIIKILHLDQDFSYQ